jgi:hypothetical protein
MKKTKRSKIKTCKECGREHRHFPHTRRTAECDEGMKSGCPQCDNVCGGCNHLAK